MRGRSDGGGKKKRGGRRTLQPWDWYTLSTMAVFWKSGTTAQMKRERRSEDGDGYVEKRSQRRRTWDGRLSGIGKRAQGLERLRAERGGQVARREVAARHGDARADGVHAVRDGARARGTGGEDFHLDARVIYSV